MDNVEKLANIKYPDTIKFPLLGDSYALIGPITFDGIDELEKKFDCPIEQIGKKLTGTEIKKRDILEIIYVLLENKDDFEDVKTFGKSVPVAAGNRLLEIIFKRMVECFPKSDGKEASEEAGESEGKK